MPSTLSILYRDDALVAINKPAGLLVHRSPIDRHETQFALQLVRDQLGQRVYPVHRLDKPTSGVLLFALSPEMAKRMGEEFQQRRVEKHYLAVVRGYSPEEGRIDHPLVEEYDKYDSGGDLESKRAQAAETLFQRLATIELPVEIETYPQSRYSLLLCKPLTGRKHQLRRHLKHINHPIIGDAKHGRGRHNRFFKEQLDAGRLLLHAARLEFHHPVTGTKLSIDAPLDETLTLLLARFDWLDRLPAVWRLPSQHRDNHET